MTAWRWKGDTSMRTSSGSRGSRSSIKRDLMSPKYRQRIVADKKKKCDKRRDKAALKRLVEES